MGQCRITVLKRLFLEDIAKKYSEERKQGHEFGACSTFKDGDVYITQGPFGSDMPEGFCTSAWTAIEKLAAVLGGGGKVYHNVDRVVACCNDGYRPVIFLLEAVDGE